MSPCLNRFTTYRFLKTSSRARTRPFGTHRGPRTASWERGARRVKDTTNADSSLGGIGHIPYVERIRESHDPTLHLKTLEDELKSTIGQALRRQADKIMYEVANMERQYESYVEILQVARRSTSPEHDYSPDSSEIPRIRPSPETRRRLDEVVERHNGHRSRALQARWELIVHRQAAGFLVNNHNVVTQTFPIKSALPEPCWEADSPGNELAVNVAEPESRRFDESEARIPDQLDWWQRIGRWR
jgi:hypothetical protein